jgi:hypothetical protein
MNTKNNNNGGPAFPHFKTDSATGYVELCPQGGMTLRDYFAGQALNTITTKDYFNTTEMAQRAYYIADAMLAAREASK